MATVPVQRTMAASQFSQQNSSNVLSFPANTGAHGVLLVFKKYKFIDPGRRGLLKLPDNPSNVMTETNGAILLPLPYSLVDSTSVRVSKEDMAAAIGAEFAAATASGNFSGYMTGVYDSFKTMGWGTGSYFLLRKALYDTPQLNAVGQGLGKVANPKSSLVFDGVNLKDFSFEWTLAPTEQYESVLIKKIINKFKTNVLPAYGENNNTNTRVMLEYPSTVDVYLIGVDPSFYMFFKTALITNVNVNYTPNGVSIMRGGVPSAVNLSIQLQEMDIHVSGDYEDGFGTASDAIYRDDTTPTTTPPLTLNLPD